MLDGSDGSAIDLHPSIAAALRASEARFQALVSISSAYAVYRMSPDWQEMRRLDGAGFLSNTERPSEHWLMAYIHPDDQSHVMAAIHEAVRTKGVFELEHRVRRVDGTLGWTLSRAVPILDADGQISEWVGAASDVSSRHEADAALRQAHAELERANARLHAEIGEREARTQLLRMLSSTQEGERARVARHLYDSVGQLLTALSLAFKVAADAGELPASSAALLTEARGVAEMLAAEVHDLATRLRPTVLDDFGLAPALAQLVAEWMRRTGVRAECSTTGLGTSRFDPELETTLYRLVQEALEQIITQTRPGFVRVVATRADGRASVRIEADGAGFDAEAMPGRLGVLAMRERAALVGGEVAVESGPGRSTTIFTGIPLRRAG